MQDRKKVVNNLSLGKIDLNSDVFFQIVRHVLICDADIVPLKLTCKISHALIKEYCKSNRGLFLSIFVETILNRGGSITKEALLRLSKHFYLSEQSKVIEKTDHLAKKHFLDILEYAILNPRYKMMCIDLLRLTISESDLHYDEAAYLSNFNMISIKDEDLERIIFDALTLEKSIDLQRKRFLFQVTFSRLSDLRKNKKLHDLQLFYASAHISAGNDRNNRISFSFDDAFRGSNVFLNVPGVRLFRPLSNRDFRYGIFNFMRMESAKIEKINFSYSEMKHAHFQRLISSLPFKCNEMIYSVIREVLFVGANLKFAKFIACKLIEVDFSEADLTGVDFSQATFFNCTFENANFDRSHNLILDIDLKKIAENPDEFYKFLVFRKAGWRNHLSVESLNAEILFGLIVAAHLDFFHKKESQELSAAIDFFAKERFTLFNVKLKNWKTKRSEISPRISRLLDHVEEHFMIYLKDEYPCQQQDPVLQPLLHHFSLFSKVVFPETTVRSSHSFVPLIANQVVMQTDVGDQEIQEPPRKKQKTM